MNNGRQRGARVVREGHASIVKKRVPYQRQKHAVGKAVRGIVLLHEVGPK